MWRRGIRLWVGSLALTAAWIALYLVVVDQERWSRDLPMTRDLLSRSITHGIVPGLAGGPWDWQRWAPASPWATPPVTVMVLGWLALAAVVAVSVLRKERIGLLWVVAVGYAVACQIPIYLMRSSKFTALELAQTLRYLPDLVVVLALLAAVGFCAPNRPNGPVGSTRSRGAHRRNRHRCSRFRRQQPLLHRDVHDNLAGQPGAALPPERRGRPRRGARHIQLRRCSTRRSTRSYCSASPRRRTLPATCSRCYTTDPNSAARQPNYACSTARGRVVDAKVTWVRTIVRGPDPQCGYLVQPDFPVRMPLDGPLLPSDWTAEINYLANSEGSMTMSLTDGVETKVPVHPGLNRVFVRLPGAGDAINVRANTAALSVCIASGPGGIPGAVVMPW